MMIMMIMMIMIMMTMIIMVMMTKEEVEVRKFCIALFLCGLNMKISSQGKSRVKRGHGSF